MNSSILAIASLLFLLLPGSLSAQREDEIWYFGELAGLDFRSGAPVVLTDGAMDQWEGVSVMSDRYTGSLLLYTDGDTVWNRNHQPMPEGTGLFGGRSSTQSAVIVPYPRDSTRFYIFTVANGRYDNRGYQGAHYSIVDMKLDGGLGAVTARNIPLYADAAEKVIVVRHCNGRSYWVLLHEENSNRFVAFEVSPSGVSATPVISAVGSDLGISDNASIGYMRMSPSLNRIALAISQSNAVELFDFDRRTGEVRNPLRIDVETGGRFGITYGVCFSPDESKLYVSGENSGYLVQFDITSRDPAQIERSEYVLHHLENWTGGIQIGPDNRLYVSIGTQSYEYLAVIRNPNLAGAACNYTLEALYLEGQRAGLGLPNFVDGAYDSRFDDCKPPTAIFSISDTIICPNECVTFTDMSIDNPTSWEWSFQGGSPGSSSARNPGQVCYATPGVYDVRLVVSSITGTDTMMRRVHVREIPRIEVSADTLICAGGGEAQLRARGVEGSPALTWVWSPAQSLSCSTCPDPIATPSTRTTYTVTATTPDGCVTTDSVTVLVAALLSPDAGADTAICLGSSVTLTPGGAATYRWQPDPSLSCTECTNPVATPQTTTVYRLTAWDETGCIGTDSVTVRVVPPPALQMSDVAAICFGDSVSLQTTGEGQFLWSPATGLSCTDCPNPTAFPKETTTYYLTATGELGCRTLDSVIVVVDQAPRIVRAHIDRDYISYPGVELVVPVHLDDRLDRARVTSFEFTLKYEPGVIQLREVVLDSLLLQGWQVLSSSSDISQGTYRAQLVSFPPRPLTGVGELFQLRFLPFLGWSRSSELEFEITLPDAECTRLITSPGLIMLDSICGFDSRLVEGTSSKYSLDAVTPNPFGSRAEIRFSLGLDGPTRLEVFDAAGELVALLVDAVLEPGSYSVAWDATDQPQGVYYYRLRSGDWSQSGRMVLGR